MLLLATHQLGCYAHGYTHEGGPRPPAPAMRAARLPIPTTGRYEVRSEGRVIGYERFTITSSAGIWRCRGQRRTKGALEVTRGFSLEVEEATAEPARVTMWFSFEGERRGAEGRRGPGVFRVMTDGIGPRLEKSVGYGRGTAVDFDSPLAQGVVLGLLAPSLVAKKPVSVRTIVLRAPSLEPQVRLFEYEWRGSEDGRMRVSVRTLDGLEQTAVWLDDTGLPVRWRRFRNGRLVRELVRVVDDDGVATESQSTG